MNILIVKMSSMGDIIHAFPAVTDLAKHRPDVQIDWLVDASFQELPKWHPAVQNVIPVPLRQMKKAWRSVSGLSRFLKSLRQLRSRRYDLIIDVQGLLKSALLARIARGKMVGFDAESAREPIARHFYQQVYNAPWTEHAIIRMRRLFAQIFQYDIDENNIDAGLAERFSVENSANEFNNTAPVIIFLPNTTWVTKQWPLVRWQKLAKELSDRGYLIEIPWGTPSEHADALHIAEVSPQIVVLPKLTLTDLARRIVHAYAVFGLDTGLLHLAAALEKPSLSFYGATNPEKTGGFGAQQFHLKANYACSPCFRRECKFSYEKDQGPPCYASISEAEIENMLKKLGID